MSSDVLLVEETATAACARPCFASTRRPGWRQVVIENQDLQSRRVLRVSNLDEERRSTSMELDDLDEELCQRQAWQIGTRTYDPDEP